MVDITALRQAVDNAQKYLNAVLNNTEPPCRSGSFTGCDSLIVQFAASRAKDFSRATTDLENAKLALQNGLNQLASEAEAAALIPQKVISNNSTLGPDLVTQNTVTQPISGQTNKIPILPIVAAIGAGLLIYTVVRKKRK